MIPVHARQFEDWPQRSIGAFRPRFLLPCRTFLPSRRANETYAYASSERNANERDRTNRGWDRAWKRAEARPRLKRLERAIVYRLDRYVWIHQR